MLTMRRDPGDRIMLKQMELPQWLAQLRYK